MKGIFITFEGFEGSGKSTQAELLCAFLKKKKKKVLHIREPGGVAISEKIREILLEIENKSMTPACEILLYMAARSQLVYEKILPMLKKRAIVVCDRFLDSTLAYQGYGCGISIPLIKQLGEFVTGGLAPDITFLCDIDVKKGLSRTSRIKDRIELRPLRYHNRVRQGYLKIAKQESKRIVVLDGHKNKKEIQQDVLEHLFKRFTI